MTSTSPRSSRRARSPPTGTTRRSCAPSRRPRRSGRRLPAAVPCPDERARRETTMTNFLQQCFNGLVRAGVPFWAALVVVPAALFVVGVVLERTLIRRLAPLDPLYNFLFTFG